jgi:hypothetical protein
MKVVFKTVEENQLSRGILTDVFLERGRSRRDDTAALRKSQALPRVADTRVGTPPWICRPQPRLLGPMNIRLPIDCCPTAGALPRRLERHANANVAVATSTLVSRQQNHVKSSKGKKKQSNSRDGVSLYAVAETACMVIFKHLVIGGTLVGLPKGIVGESRDLPDTHPYALNSVLADSSGRR